MKLVKDLQKWIDGYNEVKTLADELELSFDFYKEELVTEGDVDTAYAKASEAVEALELKNMLRDEADQMACVLKINSGAGGTESQDWASMLMRMYLRYAETNGYKATIANLQEGDEAGIKTCTINIEGDFAYGYLKGENGVHRLVRVSPYNAQGKRMTSFASVFVTPLVDDSIEVNILPAFHGIHSEAVVPVARMLIRWNPAFVCAISTKTLIREKKRKSLSRIPKLVTSRRTVRMQCASCALSYTIKKCSTAWQNKRKWKLVRRKSNGDRRFAAMYSMTVA